ncbi:MAG TPA: tRNA (guanine-N7)-methyltransferase, partial [Marmoricola sp.]|nr:tRNA (guanine-N7)-methyltransferase [Marmoricola sp.]
MSESPLPAARPHTKYTDEGRRMREVLTYSRRGSRFTPSQQESWDAHSSKWVIPESAVDQPDFSLTALFGREAPLIVEIGSGIG